MEFLNLNSIDLIIIILLLITSIIGLINGFVKELISFLIWAFSIIFSLFVINNLLIFNLVVQNVIIIMVIFFILFIFSFIILKLIIYYFLSDLKYIFNLYYINNIFGLIFGFVKGLFLILVSTSGVIYLFYTTKDFPQFFKNSLFFESIKTYSIKVIEKIIKFI